MTMPASREGVLTVTEGHGEWLPVVLDSPHSGTDFPDDFEAVAPLHLLRTGEDAYVDQLFPAAQHGAVLLAAVFPRTYIDPNRPLSDLDPNLLDGPWPEPLAPSDKSAMGKGLIWSSCLSETPIYARPLRVAEVQARIERYWRPYRTALAGALDHAHARAGAVWHINCHSMPSIWPPGVEGEGRPVEADFLLGDRDGTTCEPAFTALVKETLEGCGYTVAVNDRFKGVDIVRTCGAPASHRHSLQIEVVRARYLDEGRFERGPGFAAIQAALGTVLDAVAEHARRHSRPPAP